MRYTRRRISNDQITYNDFVGPVLAVMMSFMVVAVYQQFDASAAVVDRESGAASDLHHIADLLPQPTRGKLKVAVDRYVAVVIAKDFPAMRHGGSSMEAFDDSSQLFEIVSHLRRRRRRKCSCSRKDFPWPSPLPTRVDSASTIIRVVFRRFCGS